MMQNTREKVARDLPFYVPMCANLSYQLAALTHVYSHSKLDLKAIVEIHRYEMERLMVSDEILPCLSKTAKSRTLYFKIVLRFIVALINITALESQC